MDGRKEGRRKAGKNKVRKSRMKKARKKLGRKGGRIKVGIEGVEKTNECREGRSYKENGEVKMTERMSDSRKKRTEMKGEREEGMKGWRNVEKKERKTERRCKRSIEKKEQRKRRCEKGGNNLKNGTKYERIKNEEMQANNPILNFSKLLNALKD